MAIDPTQKAKTWLGFAFISGLAIIDLITIPWELWVRHGEDVGVFPACLVIATIVLVGPVGIKIVSSRNGNGN